MRILKSVIMAVIILAMICPQQAFSGTIKTWEEVLKNNKPVNIYVENVVNESGNKDADVALATQVVKGVFEKRITPKFKVVTDKSKADIIFSGVLTESLWMEKAPITDVYGGAALAIDLATRGKKSYARIQMRYKISAAKTGTALIDQVTQVTIKEANIPEDKSYDMVCKRASKVLAMDIFKRYKRKARGNM